MRISGYDTDEMMTWSEESVLALIHPDDRPRIQGLMTEIHAHGANRVCHLEYRFKHKEGRYFWLLDRFVFLFDANGVPAMRIGSVSDISARKRAEDALRYERQQWRASLTAPGSVPGMECSDR